MVGVLADADLYLFTGGDPPSLAALEDLGFAREGAAAVEDRLAGNGTKRMLAHIHPHHAASQEVAKAIGMVSTDTRDEEGEIAWVIEVASTEPIPDQTLDA